MNKDFALTAALGAIELHLLHHEPRCVYLDSVLPAIREALAQPEQEPLTEWLVCPKCSHKSPYSPIKAKTLAEDAERITKQTRAALAEADRKSYQAGHNAGVAHHKQANKREWVGLTDAEWSDLYEAHHDKYNLPKQGSPDGMDYERAIEAKLKKLNT